MNRLRATLQLDDSYRVAKLLGLFLTQTFFLWMFFTAGGLERLAESNLISGASEADVKRLAFEFAARWRHGMTSGWLLYMPGFFATAVAVWFWSYGLSWQKMSAEFAVTILLAVVAAMLLSPYGTGFVVESFQLQTGLRCNRGTSSVAPRVMGQGLFTLLNWGAFIAACQICLVKKTLRPLLLPAVLSMILIFIRPFTVGDFTSFWWQQIRQGEVVAIFSALLIPLLAAWFVWMLPATPAIVSAKRPTPLQSIRAEK
ncbi:MAG TPA: hypothetical protein VFZ34_11620 [Blastocatellia bacterium]|nr:hypothetical protein [Blastocatellia bacterium]